MAGRLLDSDPLTATRARFHYDHTDDTFGIETEQDVSGIIEANKADANALAGRRMGSQMHVARIPTAIYAEWEREWNAKGLSEEERQKDLARKLDDPDNRMFRTHDARLSR